MRMGLYWTLFAAAIALTHVRFGEHFYLTHFIVFTLMGIIVVRELLSGKLGLPKWMFMWVCMLLISIDLSFFSSFNTLTFRFLVPILIFYVAIFFGYWAIRDWDDIHHFLTAARWGCGIQALAGLWQSLDWISHNGFVFIANGKFWRPYGLNVSGMDYVAQLGVGLYFSALVENVFWKRLLVAFYLFQLLTSMSRTGVVIFFISVGAYLVSVSWTRMRLFVLPLAVLGLIILLCAADPENAIVRRITDIGNINFNIKRFVVYEDVISKIISSDLRLLFGQGFGTYWFFHPLDFEYYDNPHNIYLNMLYCVGVIGFLFFLGGIATLLWSTIKFYINAEPDSFPRKLIRAILLIHVSVWITGLVETNIAGLGQGWLLGFIFGVPLAIAKFQDMENAARTRTFTLSTLRVG